MNIKSFKTKVIIPTVAILVLLVVALNVFRTTRFLHLSDFLINERLATEVNALKNHLEMARTHSIIAASSMAVNTDAVQAIKEGNLNQLLRIFNASTGLYEVNYYTITDYEGKVLARTHEPDQYGDYVTNQQNVQDALGGKTSTYYEEGTAVKVSVRTGAPVYDKDGSLVGVISAGVRIDTDLEVDRLKDLLNSEVTVFLGNKRVASTIMVNGQRITDTQMEPDIADIVIRDGKEYITDATIFGSQYRIFYLPLFNASETVFAVVAIDIPEADILTTLSEYNREGVIFGFFGLIISVIVLYFIISSISKPITKISDDMNMIANGNLQIEIKTKGNDEISALGTSLKRVVEILNKLINEINVMIAEQSKGKSDFSLDINEFSGDYKTLAGNFLQLLSINTNDQLTALPNNRSFTNHLDWEWDRAVNEETSLSVLMVELDEFDQYKETFGQHQSEEALKAVAKAIRESKRSTDFAARWGGHKFSIILPATNTDEAQVIGEGIRKTIEETFVRSNNAKASKVTVSIGVSTQVPALPGGEVGNLISVSNVMLQRAQKTGKNKTVEVLT